MQRAVLKLNVFNQRSSCLGDSFCIIHYAFYPDTNTPNEIKKIEIITKHIDYERP